MAGDEDQLAPVVGQRVVEREARDCTPGMRFEPVFERAVHRRQLRHGVVRRAAG